MRKTQSYKVLVLGASLNSERYSYKAMCLLKEYGHEVWGIGKTSGEVCNVPIVTKWDHLPRNVPFHTVTIYLNPENQKMYAERLLNESSIKRVIFNPGAENPPLESQLKTIGIEVVRACTLVLLRTKQF